MTTLATTIRDTGNRRTGRPGFTLAEILIAIAIMAAGLTMAAAIFPAGIRENDRANKNAIGTIIATNGLAVVQAYYSSCTSASLSTTMQVICGNTTVIVPQSNQSAYCGFVALGRSDTRSVTGNSNFAQIVSIAYRKSGTGAVTLSNTGATVSSTTLTLSGTAPTNPRNLTGAILVSDQGEIVKAVSHVPGSTTVYLDRAFAGPVASVWFLTEDGVNKMSPSTAAVGNRISLPVVP